MTSQDPDTRPSVDGLATLQALDIRRADRDTAAFIRRIAELLDGPPGVLVDLSHSQDNGNRILLRAAEPPREPAS